MDEAGDTLLTLARLPNAVRALQSRAISLGRAVLLLPRSEVFISVKLFSALMPELPVRPSLLSLPTSTILLDWEELTPPIPARTLTNGLLLLL